MKDASPITISLALARSIPLLCGKLSRGLMTSASKIRKENAPTGGGNPLFAACLSAYVLSEVAFYFYFHYHLIPCANEARPDPDKYHDYPTVSERVALCRRILSRLKDRAHRVHHQTQEDGIQTDLEQCFRKVMTENFLQWFENKSSQTDSLQVVEASNSNLHKKPFRFSFLGSSIRRKDTGMSGISFATATTTATESTSSGDESRLSQDTSESSSESSSESLSDSSSVSSQSHEGDKGVFMGSFYMHEWSIAGLHRKDIHDFLAWAFFNKDVHQLQPDERQGVQECVSCLQEISGLIGDDQNASSCGEKEDGSCSTNGAELQYASRRMSLEDMRASHRPWIVYGVTAFSVFAMRRVVLPLMGFQRVRADSVDMVAWYRPERNSNPISEVCLFFHGIAPSGLLFYLPMIQGVFGDRQQSLLMFENPSISCQFNGPQFEALREEESAIGVLEILQKTKVSPKTQPLTLVGHSFGSCSITWMLRRRDNAQFFRDYRIKHVVLMDPVTLLLSEPTVMAKFLYGSNPKLQVVSSELFTEYYLRRHFCWYNAELWLEDFCHGEVMRGNDDPDGGGHHNDYPRFTIILSGMDEIVPSPVVHDHVLWLKDQSTAVDFDCNIVYLPNAAHGHCVVFPHFWPRIQGLVFPPSSSDKDRKNGTPC
mmetsp:Transcript_5359/g.15121  ORF Transcript_5359/g.15121 Transcript_5359/m.15121 type:complete len:655 (+) Transcript_5359:24-1988(+)